MSDKTIIVIINDELIQRSAHVIDEFLPSNNPVALAMRQIFPWIYVYEETMRFCNRDGYEVVINIPEHLKSWIRVYNASSPGRRKNMDMIKFTLKLSPYMIYSSEAPYFTKALSRSKNARLA